MSRTLKASGRPLWGGRAPYAGHFTNLPLASRHCFGLAAAVAAAGHFTNLPLASRHCCFAGAAAAAGHLMNLPAASRHWGALAQAPEAANASPTVNASAVVQLRVIRASPYFSQAATPP